MRTYKANMIPGGTTPVINVSQYDNDYAVTVTLIEGAEIYTPPVGATIRVEGTKPDGNGFEYPCTYQGNVVTMPIYTQMTVVSGRFPIELVVYQNGLRVGSCNIVFAVEKAPLGEDTDISETVIPDIIAGAQAQADAAAASATQAASSAASAETAKTAAMGAAEDAIEAAQELETAVQFNSALIKETVSGDIAIFADGSDNIPVQSVVAKITPVQSGSGDPSPSNIRPISGRTGLTVTRAGKNLLSLPFLFYTVPADTDNCFYLPNGTYTFSFSDTTVPSWRFILRLYDLDGTEVTSGNFSSTLGYRPSVHGFTNGIDTVIKTFTFTLDKGYYVRILFWGSTVASDTVFTDTQLEIGSTATAYEPYAGQTFPITWESIAGTVYGGTLDVTTGVLTVTDVCITLTNSSTHWQKSTAYPGNFFIPSASVAYDYNVPSIKNYVPFVCSHAKSVTRVQDLAYGCCFMDGSVNICITQGSDTVEDWRNYLDAQVTAGTPVQICCQLVTPQTYQLTPTEVRTILGGNTIYTDAGAVSVEYVADTKLYIDNKIAELQALILEN